MIFASVPVIQPPDQMTDTWPRWKGCGPELLIVDNTNDPAWWPIVEDDDWCSEWETRPTGERDESVVRTMSDDNGQGIPIVGGLPLLSQATPWSWEIHPIGRDDQTGEKVFILRLRLPTGPFDLWAPASFLKDLGERLTAMAAGLHIAGEMPPQ